MTASVNRALANAVAADEVVFGLVVNDTTAAAANTAKMQAALNARGTVRVVEAGVIYFIPPLVIDSNTKLQLGANTTLKRTAASGDFLLTTAAYQAAGTAVALTWTSGTSVSVAWTAHGKVVGDFVSLYGGLPSEFLGTFQVTAATDADNFVVALRRIPTTTPTGSFFAKATTVNWEVTGGTWDYNYTGGSNNSSGIGRMGFMAFFSQNHRIHDLKINDVIKYCVFQANCADAYVKNLNCNTNSDGVHTFGPAFNTLIEGISGKFGDDIVAVSSRDVPSIYSDVSAGDIIGFTARNIQGESSANHAQCYAYTGYVMDDVLYEGVLGKLFTAYGDTTNGGTIKRLTLRNFNGLNVLTVAPYAAGTVDITVQELILDQCVFNTADGLSLFTPTANTKIKQLRVKDCVINNSAWGATSAPLFNYGSGQIENLHIDGGRYFLGANGRLIGGFNGSNGSKTISVCGAYTENGNSIINKGSSQADTPVISLERNHFKAVFDVLALSSNADVQMRGNLFDTCTTAVHVYNAAATAVNVWEDGNKYVSTTRVTCAAGVYNPKSFSCQVDVGATGLVKTVSGSMCFNTGSGRGTLTQNRLVTCNGTNWVQVDDATKVF